ncbi:MAG: hypothetical protein H5U40_08325, partial [Polyangiaceae bacterium]|nr:hypothetical protein [Polyangiaceae bacterium]
MADESKRLPYGLIAATVILLGAYAGLRVFAPEYLEPPEAQEQTSAPTEAPQATRQGAAASGRSAEDRRARQSAEQTARIETADFVATFSNLNTGLRSLELRGEKFRRATGEAEELVTTDREEYLPYSIRIPGVSIPEDAVWEVEQVSPTAVNFRWEGSGVVVTRKIEAGKGPFQLWSTVTVHNRGSAARDVGLVETIHHYVTRDEEDEGV